MFNEILSIIGFVVIYCLSGRVVCLVVWSFYFLVLFKISIFLGYWINEYGKFI